LTSIGRSLYGRPPDRERGATVVKAELGTKRLCPNCGARYYDLNRDPIICPRCGTVFELASARARPQAAAVVEIVADKVEVEAEAEATAPKAEFVSLEEADSEAADSGVVAAEVDDDEEDDIDTEGEDATFLAEDDEEDDEDVGDIIGDVDDEDS
jgi:uncharacterized protein (TIGR02300 family)